MIELWPAAPGDSADQPLLKLRSLAAERDGEDRAVIVYLDEVKSRVAALARERAAVKLASEQAALEGV